MRNFLRYSNKFNKDNVASLIEIVGLTYSIVRNENTVALAAVIDWKF